MRACSLYYIDMYDLLVLCLNALTVPFSLHCVDMDDLLVLCLKFECPGCSTFSLLCLSSFVVGEMDVLMLDCSLK